MLYIEPNLRIISVEISAWAEWRRVNLAYPTVFYSGAATRESSATEVRLRKWDVWSQWQGRRKTGFGWWSRRSHVRTEPSLFGVVLLFSFRWRCFFCNFHTPFLIHPCSILRGWMTSIFSCFVYITVVSPTRFHLHDSSAIFLTSNF